MRHHFALDLRSRVFAFSARCPASPSREFDPLAFTAKLQFTDEVSELGLTEEDATRLQICFTRGKVYFPIRNEDGSIRGFIGYADGELKLPPQWLQTNVVKLKRAKKASLICGAFSLFLWLVLLA